MRGKLWSLIYDNATGETVKENYLLAISLVEDSLGCGTKCADLDKRSTKVMIQVLPSDKGRPVTKSREI